MRRFKAVASSRILGRIGLIVTILLGMRIQAQETPPFWMAWPEGELRLAFEYIAEEWSRSGRTELGRDEYHLTEEVELHTKGHVYHERFMTFDASGTVGLEQAFIDSNSTDRDPDTDVLDTGHDVRATFFGEHPVSVDFFSQRQNNEVRRAFFGLTEITSTHLGADARIKYETLPTLLHFDHATTKGEGFDNTDQVLNTFLLDSRNNVEGSDTRLRYEFSDYDIRSVGQGFSVNDALLTNLFLFGEEDRHRTTTSALFRDQSGDVDSRLLGLRNTTTLNHTDKFSTHHAVSLDHNDLGPITQRTGTGTVGMSHTLYQNLTTALAVRAGRSEIAGGTIDSYGGRADWTYRRTLPFGSLRLGAGLDYKSQDEEGLGSDIPIIDEPHTFRVGDLLFLDERFPDETSVVITDDGALTGGPITFFIEGVDYILISTGPLLRVQVPLGSRISDGQLLLVDYNRRTMPDRMFSTFTKSASGHLEFGRYLTLYANWAGEDVDLISGQSDATLADSERLGAGAQAFWGPTTTRFDYEKSISPFLPYERISVSEFLAHEFSEEMSGTLRGGYSRSRFTDENTTEETVDGALGMHFRFGDSLWAEIEGGYRWGRLRTDDEQGVLASASLGWTFYAYDLRVTLRHVDSRFRVANDYLEDRVFIEIRRKF